MVNCHDFCNRGLFSVLLLNKRWKETGRRKQAVYSRGCSPYELNRHSTLRMSRFEYRRQIGAREDDYRTVVGRPSLSFPDDVRKGIFFIMQTQSTKSSAAAANAKGHRRRRMNKQVYESELFNLQKELVKLQEWVKARSIKVVVIFEGRDAAGKGGVIKRITQFLNPRVCRVVALPKPTEREATQWYFQRYCAHLPAAGEIALFDRSWYNRAGVEHVMKFCSDDEYTEFLRSCPVFERMLVRSDIKLLKYWFSVSDEEQEQRFQSRIAEPHKRWKLSPMDLESRRLWVEYSRAKDHMFAHTDIKQAPWYVVDADDKRRARLNCIRHLLEQIPYEDLTPDAIELPERTEPEGYIRPPFSDQTFVENHY